MIVALDVNYGDAETTTALVAFTGWQDATPARELSQRSDQPPAQYVPGQFFQRELPHLLAIIEAFAAPITTAIIDGYVELSPGRHGLGWHLHQATQLHVIGVAKTHFHETAAIEIRRGTSARPLYVTSTDDPQQAAEHIRSMHGEFRIPTLLKRADSLCRGFDQNGRRNT